MKPSTASLLGRISLALALSILVHIVLLWQWPTFELTPPTALPELQAKLEPLPKLAKQKRSRKPRAKNIAPQVTEINTNTPALTATEPVTPPAQALVETTTHPTLPKHVQLHFTVEYGDGTLKVGEVIHVLENLDGQYSIRAETQTTGLVGFFKNYKLIQTSTGTVTQQGLRPDGYMELKTDSSGTQLSSANFDWVAHKIYFDDGNTSALIDQAQDMLSLPYQLSQLPLLTEKISIAWTNGRGIRQHTISIGEETILDTPYGELRTIALHKVRRANEDGLIVWLALEFRLLPVKIQYLNKSGEVTANMVITDIRVSDE